jgi:hypothetical protein
VSEPPIGGLRMAGAAPASPGTATGPRELFVRHARKEGRSVAVLRAVDYGDSCVVEAEVYPIGARSAEPTRPGPYTFLNASEATQFVTQAVEALMVLGCDVHAQ